MATGADPPDPPDIAAALGAWRQGDCSLGRRAFVSIDGWGTDDAASGTPDPDLDAVDVHGVVLITQTCDVVQFGRQRAYVQVAPLVVVDDAVLRETVLGLRIQYGYVPGVAEHGLVADLGRVMTVSKSALAVLERVEGCRTDEERRSFAQALVRKFARTAFPDDFAKLIDPLRRRILSKHKRASREGEVLRAMWDVRVTAAPSWSAETVDVLLWFVCDAEVPEDAADHLEKWLQLVPASGRFASIEGQFVTLDEMSARDHVESDPLDFEHLSDSAT